MELMILFGVFLGLMILGVPIAFCLAVAALCTAMYMGLPPLIVFQQMNEGISSFAMIAIPLFIFAGELMMRGGVADRMINFAGTLVGHIRGGLGQVNITSSVLLSGISGSPIADASAIGGIMVPQMVKRGYARSYAVNVTISSAVIALMIPPSPNLILYAVAGGGGISIADLFTAGILPGLLLAAALLVTAYVQAVRKGYPAEPFAGVAAIGRALVAATPAIVLVVVIFGGVRFGVFTPTESACVAVLYVFGLMLVVMRMQSWHVLMEALSAAVRTTAMVLFIIAAAASFGWFMAFLQVPSYVISAMSSMSDSPYVAMALILVSLLLLGTFMDLSPMIIITTPIFLPVAQNFGVDPVHFGIVMILAAGIGLYTPPVGTLLFVGCAVGKISVSEVLRTIWPYYIASGIVLLMVAYIPAISLWLPALFR
ncbi:C4-dicarboxylate ABC transporter permease [Bordetella sp. J329]|jgi:tripartite ATP-independent transporter DctM subunit|uniref:TRAP transporter large permease n=1 Tax=Kerstersia gyiorum TaxID=206506 RepID=UPI000FD9BF4C|nr:TRAP transporter large permease [Kerstersia gyiorum]AZV92784.1 C4-dicarboxylate ABC transporter permease [Bordetella sp. J329]MCH4272729.1 TRAP transporter large permease [Kerstersia gyiorum]MCI1230272.1 TRAP transporter large permease [Kerstersia gyiorum]